MTSLKHQLKSALYMPRYSGASLVAQTVKNLPAMQETQVRSLSPEDPLENRDPLQYPCLKNSMDRGAWWGIVDGISKSQTWLSDKHYTFHQTRLQVPFMYFLMSYVCLSSVQFSSVAQSCPTLCDPMNHSTPGLPVHHKLLELTQTHVHREM